ncbi:MAG: hypothetical protein KHX55_02545 [Proteobacteria bacterium]|nr:hypothetical protein [Pseudomonadota bacterium]
MNTLFSQRQPNTTSSDYNSLNFAIWQQLAQVNTMELAVVVAVNDDNTLDAKPLLNTLTPDNEAVEPTVIHNIPYLRIQAGGNAIKIKPQIRDIGLIGYCQRDISGILSSKGQANPQSNRKFSNSDAVYIYSVVNLAAEPIRYIEISDNQITVNGNVPLVINASAMTVNADLTVNGNIKATGDVTAGSISLKNHLHGGVTPGDGLTGAPQ